MTSHPHHNAPPPHTAGSSRQRGRKETATVHSASPGAGCLINNNAPRHTVAALFVESGGPYFGIPGVDPWDLKRDAMQYRGPHPVVAHPPCQLWGSLAAVNYARWGGEHNRPGNDGGKFAFALDAVNRFGGVLEHPAKTKAWPIYGLGRPIRGGWIKSGAGWVCEVWQSAYGHQANKATWLYYRGERLPPSLDWSRPKGTHQIGGYDQRGPGVNKPTLWGKRASATPHRFRDLLIEIAVGSSSRSGSEMEAAQ